jgi:DNA-directed RNA polymerase subunit RPC12/RpoP
MNHIFISTNGERRGPYVLSQIQSMWNSGAITADALYWEEGMEGAKSILDLLDELRPGSASKDFSVPERRPDEVKFECAHCGQHISAPLDQAGIAATCPTCGASVTIPSREFGPPPIDSVGGRPTPSAQVNGVQDVERIAKWRKMALWLATISTTGFIGGFFLGPLQCITIIGIFALPAFNYRMSKLLKLRRSWTYAAVSIFPILNVLALLTLSRKAKTAINQAGGWTDDETSQITEAAPKVGGFTIPVLKPAHTAALILVAVVILIGIVAEHGSSSSSANQQHISLEEATRQNIQQSYDQIKQQLFDQFHPVGTAKSVTVHDLTFVWKDGINTGRWSDVKQVIIPFTLYWEGPITKDGFTKISATYDTESQRYISSQVIATNGITTDQAGSAIGEALGIGLGAALEYQAQKNGAEQGTQNYLNQQQ